MNKHSKFEIFGTLSYLLNTGLAIKTGPKKKKGLYALDLRTGLDVKKVYFSTGNNVRCTCILEKKEVRKNKDH